MAKKYSSWMLNQPVSMPTMKLKTVKGDEQDPFKNIEKVEASPHMNSTSSSTRINTRTIRPSLISKQSVSYFAAPTIIPPPVTLNKQKKIRSIDKPTSIPTLLSTPIQTRKHKHHQHNGKHRHHHRCNQTKTGKQHYKILSPSKHLIKSSSYIDQIAKQQSKIVYQKAPKTELVNIRLENDHQQTALVVYRDATVPQLITTDEISQPVVLHQDQEIKTKKGNIPLQPIENKLLSQRAAPTNEAQVGNYNPMICTEPISSILDTNTNFYGNDICLPSPAITCTCHSQLPQQEILVCTEPTLPQELFCSIPNDNIIQQATIPQQQLICVDTTPSIINQIPTFNCLPTQSFISVPQPSLQQNAGFVIQQPSLQQNLGFVIQQPSLVQNQPVQIIQNASAQPGQYLRISSATPQIIQRVQAPGIQQVQPQIFQAQNISASPQMLYQRPYDPIILPAQNQPITIAHSPFAGLSQPSYAPARMFSGLPAVGQPPPGPNMFRNAVIRNVAARTGIPVIATPNVGVQTVQSPFANPLRGGPFAPRPSPSVVGDIQRSASMPIVPLSPGGLLIPCQLSEPERGMIHGALPRSGGLQSTLTNFDKVRRQIQQRAQFLADFQQRNFYPTPPLPVNSANTGAPRIPVFSTNAPIPPPLFSSNAPVSSPLFASNAPVSPPVFGSNAPVSPPIFSPSEPVLPPVYPSYEEPLSTPPVPSSNIPQSSSAFLSTAPPPAPSIFTSQTPYARGNVPSSSSSSSSRSSASSVRPASSSARPSSTGLIYAQPSFVDSRNESNLSEPPAPYQSFRP